MQRDKGVEEMQRIRAAIEAHPLADSLGALLDQRAQEQPDAILANFFHDDVTLSYQELASQSRKFASSLLRLGVRKGSHVALVAPNSAPFLIAWFAIARLGAVMVPINHRYTARELQFTLTDADAQFLIIDQEVLPVFRSIETVPALLIDGQVIVIGEGNTHDEPSFQDLVSNGDPAFSPPEAITNSDLLSIQFTSGSTGLPKGCMQSHLYWLMLGFSAARHRLPDDGSIVKNVLVTYPLFYMMAQMEFMMALINSGTAVIARQPSLTNFMNWVREYSIHYCAMNPMVYRGLPVKPDDGENELKFIAAYFHRGDGLRELQTRFNAIGRDAFGMTEIGAGTVLPADATHMIDSGSCGLPSAYREAKVCDPQGAEAPVGEPGELCFKGSGMFWGYYKRPKTNRDSFHDGCWFRTGDLARVDENGYVYIIGRIKEMIKRSGENISAMEVETALREHPDIQEAAAIAVADYKRMEEVRAVITLRNGKTRDEVTPDVLIAHCQERLSEFKVPRYYSYVDEFPRTGSNKIDKPSLLANGVTDDENGKPGANDTFDRLQARWLTAWDPD